MSIYTKSGDKGKTSLLGGTRVSKSHNRIQAIGAIDELIAYIGVIRCHNIKKEYKDMLISAQSILMQCCTQIANEKKSGPNMIKKEYTSRLEKQIDKMEEKLPPMKGFILPGGNLTVANCHVARTICRRAERSCVELSDIEEEILQYINRLGDFLYVISGTLVCELNVEENLWKPDFSS